MHQVVSVVIPALNEEQAIGATVARCLAAREEICRASGLREAEIIVVSDGSTDRTAEIARGFAEIRVIELKHNRGYGGAIKEGFRRARGTLLGFLDADGTCDPRYFGEMCRLVVDDGVEVALGSRLGPQSSMPRVRRIGNRMYALMLGILTGRSVTDTASGMRVLTRSAFEQLSPLPDGLHFTPSMSARALINGMKIVELPMAYAERIGASKLHVVLDGVRFLRTILEGVLSYRPDRIFLMGFLACFLLVLLMGIYPLEFYFHHGRVEEWMIYRFLASFLFGSAGFLLLSATALAHRMASFGPTGRATDSFLSSALARMFTGRPLGVLMAAHLLAAIALVWPGIMEYLTTATCTLHWSRVVVGGFAALVAFQAAVTGVLIQVVELWLRRREEMARIAAGRSASLGLASTAHDLEPEAATAGSHE
jgi:glycosyltransferase involved in cell wall biosynthesis